MGGEINLPTTSEAGAAIYNPFVLRFYDWFVHGVSNRFIWRCPTETLLAQYNQHVSQQHLDVGVGTGYFLDKCTFPAPNPSIALVDLNPNTLAMTARRIVRYHPRTLVADALKSIALTDLGGERFDSLGLTYVLHCLPGNLRSKGVIFAQLRPLLNPSAVIFGATLLGQGVPKNMLARGMMGLYNGIHAFSNNEDTRTDLEAVLKANSVDYAVTVQGCVALFVAHV